MVTELINTEQTKHSQLWHSAVVGIEENYAKYVLSSNSVISQEVFLHF